MQKYFPVVFDSYQADGKIHQKFGGNVKSFAGSKFKIYCRMLTEFCGFYKNSTASSLQHVKSSSSILI